MPQEAILQPGQFTKIIKRLAFEIVERNFSQSQFILAGIAQNGHHLASQLCDAINQIAPDKKTSLHRIDLNKKHPLSSEIRVNPEYQLDANTTVLVIDDVLYTGKTLMYATWPFLQEALDKIQTVVLVQRDFAKFPIAANYVGIDLATTYQEHVDVILQDDEASVKLSR